MAVLILGEVDYNGAKILPICTCMYLHVGTYMYKCLSAAFNFRCYMCFCVVIHTERENKIMHCCDSLCQRHASAGVISEGRKMNTV